MKWFDFVGLLFTQNKGQQSRKKQVRKLESGLLKN